MKLRRRMLYAEKKGQLFYGWHRFCLSFLNSHFKTWHRSPLRHRSPLPTIEKSRMKIWTHSGTKSQTSQAWARGPSLSSRIAILQAWWPHSFFQIICSYCRRLQIREQNPFAFGIIDILRGIMGRPEFKFILLILEFWQLFQFPHGGVSSFSYGSSLQISPGFSFWIHNG